MLPFDRFLRSLCPHLGLGHALRSRRQRGSTRGRGGLYEPRAPRRGRGQMLERLPDQSLHLDSCWTDDYGVAGKWKSLNDVTKFGSYSSHFVSCHDTSQIL